jgi:hypothetical protein
MMRIAEARMMRGRPLRFRGGHRRSRGDKLEWRERSGDHATSCADSGGVIATPARSVTPARSRQAIRARLLLRNASGRSPPDSSLAVGLGRRGLGRFRSLEPCSRTFGYTPAPMTEIADTFDSAFTKAVDLGNRLADRDKDADLWDIADGLLAGALQYWLYSRQPCGDPRCQDCMPISTAEGRMAELKKLVEQLAAESEYFHTPTDANAGRA